MNMWQEIPPAMSLLPCSLDYQRRSCCITKPQCRVPGYQELSRALGSKGEGATQNAPGTHTCSEMLGTAFWAACSTTKEVPKYRRPGHVSVHPVIPFASKGFSSYPASFSVPWDFSPGEEGDQEEAQMQRN